MKRKIFGSILLGMSCFLLVACGNAKLAQPTVSKSFSSYQKIAPKQSSSKSSAKEKMLLEQETVTNFLKAYTTYSSLNAQRSQMRTFLTPDLQKEWAVESPVSVSLNQVTSAGEIVSLSRSSNHTWLGIVKVTINDQTHHLAVFELETVQSKDKFQIRSCTDLNQE